MSTVEYLFNEAKRINSSCRAGNCIYVKDFDDYVQSEIEDNYVILHKSKNEWLVSKDGFMYKVYKANEANTCGRRYKRIIIDSRIDLDFIKQYIMPGTYYGCRYLDYF